MPFGLQPLSLLVGALLAYLFLMWRAKRAAA